MSFPAWLVKTILDSLDLDIPWRGIGTVMVAVLLLVAYTDRSAFTAGVEAWSVGAACQADHQVVNVLSAVDQLPRMTVTRTNGLCTIKVIQSAVGARTP